MHRRDFMKLGILGLIGCKWFKNEPYDARYETIGHKVLEVESEFRDINNAKRIFDGLLTKTQEVKGKDKSVMPKLADIIKSYKHETEAILFSESLEKQKSDCIWRSIFYYSVGQLNSWPINVVLSRHHAFVRFGKDNFETTDASFLEDKHYKLNHMIADNSEVYLKNINEDSIMAMAYTTVANAFYRKMDLKKAERLYQKAMKLDPKNPYNLRSYAALHYGHALTGNSDYSKALELLTAEIAVDPNAYYAHSVLGDIYSKLGEEEKARKSYDASLKTGGIVHFSQEKQQAIIKKIFPTMFKKQ